VAGEQRDLVTAGGRVDLHRGELEPLLDQGARGVDMLDPHHRHDGVADRERPVADLDRVRPHVPAPAAPAQLRYDGDAHQQADQRQPTEPVGDVERMHGELRGDRRRDPEARLP
jgi:hypothetical protein